MSTSRTYQVIITNSRKINITMANNNGTQLRTYAHFVTTEDARRFADILEKSLAERKCWDVDRCQLCGKAFIRQNRLCLLKDGRVIHEKCLQKAVNCGEISYGDCKEYWNHYFPRSALAFDYCNLEEGGDRSENCRYAIQTISREVVHIYLIEPGGYLKHYFCLTSDECHGLIQEIREKSDLMDKYHEATVGKCACCGNGVCMDESYYVLASGELVHGSCMVRLVRPAPNSINFPGRRSSIREQVNPSP